MQLSKFIAKLIFTIALITTFLAFFVTIVFQYNSFEKDKVYIKKEFIEEKKNEIKKEVRRVIDFIEHEHTQTDVDFISEENMKKEILSWISKIRFSQDGYIFVNTLDGKALVFDGKLLKEAKIYPNEELFKQQLKAIENPNGAFFSYNFKKLNSEKEFPKISFVKKYEKYNWIIGSGTYLDGIDSEIQRKENIFKKTILEEINFFILILMFIIIIIYFITKKISEYINNNINNLISAFEIASIKNKSIDTSSLTFKEFISLANKLNITLENKNKVEEKLQDYIKIVNEHVIISTTDANGIIQNVSEAFCKISGYSKEELIGKSHNILRNEDVSENFYEELCKKLGNEKIWKGEIENKNKQGETYWVEAIIQTNFEKDKFIGYTVIRTDITNKKKVEYLSITDELTQVYNRRYFNKVIEEELNKRKREDLYISFMMIDIDYFKRYNDTYGHQAGDQALKKISAVFRLNSKRSGDFIFRLGGEEFAILFTSNSNRKAFDFANSLKDEIENLKIEHKTSSVSTYITTSIGLINKKANEVENSAELYKLADEALYKAKRSGRNCIYMKQ